MVRSLYLSPYLCPSIRFAMELIAWSLSNLRRDNHIMKRIIFSIEFQMSLQPRQQQQQIFPKSLTYAIYPWHGNSSAIIHQIQLKIFYKHIQLINRRRHRRNTYDVCVRCAHINNEYECINLPLRFTFRSYRPIKVAKKDSIVICFYLWFVCVKSTQWLHCLLVCLFVCFFDCLAVCVALCCAVYVRCTIARDYQRFCC